jgi:hypothetical protein
MASSVTPKLPRLTGNNLAKFDVNNEIKLIESNANNRQN